MNKIIDVQPGLLKSWALRVEMASVGKKNTMLNKTIP